MTVQEAARRLTQIASLTKQLSLPTPPGTQPPGRNRLTRTIDAVLLAIRRYFRPLHWIVVVVSAVVLLLYAHFCAWTGRLTATGGFRWPDVPCVLALWHGDAPSLLVAIAAQRPETKLVIMIATDPRGDILSLLCRLLGLRVVRGDSSTGGWEALDCLAGEIEQGASVVMTADGGGPARMAKVGAVALAAATSAPLFPVGANCTPALAMPHKWDAARNPVPFGRVAIAIGEPLIYPIFHNPMEIETARQRLQQALNEIASKNFQG